MEQIGVRVVGERILVVEPRDCDVSVIVLRCLPLTVTSSGAVIPPPFGASGML
jgi:hypothetical protein